MRKVFGVTTAMVAILLSGAAYAAGEGMIQAKTKAPFGSYLADGSGRAVYRSPPTRGREPLLWRLRHRVAAGAHVRVR